MYKLSYRDFLGSDSQSTRFSPRFHKYNIYLYMTLSLVYIPNHYHKRKETHNIPSGWLRLLGNSYWKTIRSSCLKNVNIVIMVFYIQDNHTMVGLTNIVSKYLGTNQCGTWFPQCYFLLQIRLRKNSSQYHFKWTISYHFV